MKFWRGTIRIRGGLAPYPQHSIQASFHLLLSLPALASLIPARVTSSIFDITQGILFLMKKSTEQLRFHSSAKSQSHEHPVLVSIRSLSACQTLQLHSDPRQ
jgi:hypothetical protein